jgi:hypothetical protein
MPRPFNEDLLWKSKMQRSNFPAPVAKPPMELPEVNPIIGGTVYNSQIFEDMNKSYTAYSTEYWAGVRMRHAEYRRLNAVTLAKLNCNPDQ